MIKKNATIIDDFSGGQDTKTPILKMPLIKSPNMRNFHCAGIGNRLMKRGGFAKVNSSTVETDGLDVFYPPGYQTTDYALRDTATRTKISQGFKPNITNTVTKVRLWLKKTGTPAGTDTITLTIQTDSSGVPSNSVVTNGTATAVDISDTLTTSYAWVTFTFSTNPSLTADTQYHLVLSGAADIDGNNYVLWGVDNYDVIYNDGAMAVNDGTTWTSESLYDAIFEVYITNGSKGNDGVALFDFNSKNMLLAVYGTKLYKMDKTSAGTPDGTWDAIDGGSAWDTYTKLMLHFDGSDASTTFTDEIGKTVTAVGNAQLDTAQKKFDTASLLLDGTGDYATLDDSDDWNFAQYDFTIEAWVRFNSLTGNQVIYSHAENDASKYITVQKLSGGQLEFSFTLAGVAKATTTSGVSLSTNTWYHVAVSRSGSTLKIFLDGVSQTLTGDSLGSGTLEDVSTTVKIGSFDGTQSYFNGWIDELRVSKGIARFTSNFTPATSAYSATSLTLTSSRYWTFADWQSGRALINTDIGLYTYTGTGSSSVVSAAPLGKYFLIWKNYAFIFGLRGSPNNGRYSDLSDYTTWPAGNTFNNAFNTNDGDVITGVRILKGKLYVFKRYSIHRVTHLGSNPTFQVDQILGTGCPSHYCIKEVDLGGEIGTVLIFPSTDKKLIIFDGYNLQVINDNLSEETNDLFGSADDQPITFADMDYTYIDQFHAVVKSDTSEYILYAVLSSDVTPKYAFVFDYKVGGIFPYDEQYFYSSVYAISTSKAKKLYCAGGSGYMWEIESGNSDDGADINAYWVSGKIKPSAVSILNRMLQVGMSFKEISSGSTINISFQYRLDWNTTWTTAEETNFNRSDDYSFGKTVLFDVGTIENMFQIKIKDDSSNPAPTIYEFNLYGDPLGVSAPDRATA